MHFDRRETKSAKECRRESANLLAFPPKRRGGGADMWAGPRSGRAPRRGRSLDSGRDPARGRAPGEGGVASPPLPIFSPHSVPPCYVSSRSRQAQRLRESRESGRRTQSGGSTACASLWLSEVGGFLRVAAKAGARTGECEDSDRPAETGLGEGTLARFGDEPFVWLRDPATFQVHWGLLSW